MYRAVLHLFRDEYQPALLEARRALHLAVRDRNLWHIVYANSLFAKCLMAMKRLAETLLAEPGGDSLRADVNWNRQCLETQLV